MKFVTRESVGPGLGLWYSPARYLDELSSFVSDLPRGAREFATDPDRYDQASSRRLKDLEICKIETTEVNRRKVQGLSTVVYFEPNKFIHAGGLKVVYEDVRSFRIDVVSFLPMGRKRLGDLIIDEVLPSDHGVNHEVLFEGGTLTVEAADLVATWVSAGSDGAQDE